MQVSLKKLLIVSYIYAEMLVHSSGACLQQTITSSTIFWKIQYFLKIFNFNFTTDRLLYISYFIKHSKIRHKIHPAAQNPIFQNFKIFYKIIYFRKSNINLSYTVKNFFVMGNQ